eukprot:12540323-Alexandrium_andersonii.AAC.1
MMTDATACDGRQGDAMTRSTTTRNVKPAACNMLHHAARMEALQLRSSTLLRKGARRTNMISEYGLHEVERCTRDSSQHVAPQH